MSNIPRRQYGNTDEQLSILGFGGIVVMNADQDHANRVIAEAVEWGINYFDVAPGYGDAEIKMGPGLEPYRKSCFLACKTSQRERGPAQEEFERSLERLRTDYFDLYQLHGIYDVEKDVEPAFANGSVVDMMIEEKKKGRIKYLGFSTHSEEAGLAALERYDFDSVLMPVNSGSYLTKGWGKKLLTEIDKRGIGLLALKAMGRSKWEEDDPMRDRFSKCWYRPEDDPEMAELMLRWTLSQPNVVAAVSPGEEEMLRMGWEFATRFTPITPEEEERLREYAQGRVPVFPDR